LSNVLKTLEVITRWVREFGNRLAGVVHVMQEDTKQVPARLSVARATRRVAQRPRRDQSRPV